MRLFLASPYTHENMKIREQRYHKALLYAGLLIEAGHHVYSPIVHNHPIAEVRDLPGEYEYWRQSSVNFIEWCDAVVVLMIDGWAQSAGIRDEKAIAFDLNKPTIHWNPVVKLPDLDI